MRSDNGTQSMLRLTADDAQAMQILQHRETVVQVTTEYENVRLALTWFEERGDLAALLQLGVALYGFWIARGLLNEGLRWLERALERSGDSTSSTWRVQALNGATNLALFQGEARAEAFITESLAAAYWVNRFCWDKPSPMLGWCHTGEATINEPKPAH